MAFTTGLELVNNELAFAEHQNVELMGARGNQVIDSVGVTPQGSPDLTVAVASGNVLAGGVVVAVSGGNIDLSSEHGALTSGQAQFVFIHVNSSGTKSSTAGVAAAAGQQLPADVPEDEVVLAQVTLTEGDPTIDSVDIEDWKINVPKGGYFAGDLVVNGASGVDNLHIIGDEDQGLLLQRLSSNVTDNVGLRFKVDVDTGATVIKGGIFFQRTTSWSRGIIHFANEATADGTNVTIADSKLDIYNNGDIKNPVDNAGFFTGASDQARFYHNGADGWITNAIGDFNFVSNQNDSSGFNFFVREKFILKDDDGSDVNLFVFDMNGRTLTIGALADLINTTKHGTLNIKNGVVGTEALLSSGIANGDQSGLVLLHARGSQTSPTASQVVDGNTIIFKNFDGSNHQKTASIIVRNDSHVTTSGDSRGKMFFFTTPSGSVTPTEKMSINSAGLIKNPIDNAGFHTGASDELRVYHTGSAGNAFILNTVGSLILDQDTAAGDIELQLGGSVLIKDTDDGGVTLFDFNTDVSGGRTLVIGGVADNIGVRINGTLDVSGDVLPTADGGANLGSDAFEWDELFVQDQIIFSSPPVNVGLNLSLLGDSVVVASSSLSYKYDMDYLEDIEINATKIINALKPIKYRYNEDERIYKGHEFIKFGFAAEEFQLATEESLDLRNDNGSSLGIVYKDGKADGYEPMFLGAITVKALQEQNTYIKELERRILVLEGAK